MAFNKGKWYFEYKIGHTCAAGFIGDTHEITERIRGSTAVGTSDQEFAWEGNGYMKTNGGQSAYGSSASASDIIGMYVDLDNNKLYIGINGTIQNSGTGYSITDPDSLTSGFYYVGGISDQCGATANVTADMNFGDGFFGTTAVTSAQSDANGHGIFEYSPNDGGGSSFDGAAKNFYAMNTGKHEGVWIMAITFHPKDYFKTLTYTGNAGTNAITGVGFQPGFTWIKISRTDNHVLVDALRGTNRIRANTANQEADISGDGFTSLDSDGFTLNGSGGGGEVNANAATFVSWNWKGGTTSGIATNGSTTITPSSYSFDQARGFSILKFTGNGVDGAKLAHGLGAKPEVLWLKTLTGGDEFWQCYWKSRR